MQECASLVKKLAYEKKEREASKQEGYISKSVQFKDGTKPAADYDGSDMNDEYYDSDELVYDSEEEAEQDRLF